MVGALVAACLAVAGLTAQPAQAADTGAITGKVFTKAVGGQQVAVTGGYIYLYELDEDGYYDSVDSVPSTPLTDSFRFTGNTFTIGALKAGTYKFEVAGVDSVDGQEYQREHYNDAEYLTSATAIQVGDVPVTVNDMVLEPSGQITGQVKDADGTPIPNATVSFFSTETGGASGVTADGNGFYTSADLLGGGLVKGQYRVAARHDDYTDPDGVSHEEEYWQNATTWATSTAVTVNPGLPTGNVDFSLDVAPRMRLTVKDPAGNPLPNVNVGIWVFYNGAWGPYQAGPNTTDDDGIYRRTLRIGDRYKFFITPPPGVDGVTEWYDNAYTEAAAKEVKATAHGEVIDIEIRLGDAPAVTGATPTISGTPAIGQTLTANTGTWGPTGVSLAYQWLADDVPIAGATQATYTPTVNDAAKAIKVKVTGTLANHTTTSRTSAPTAAIPRPVVAGETPTISGTPEVGTTLTANSGAWGPTGVSLAYQWLADDVPIAGATQATYAPVAADVAKTLKVKVTGTLANHTTTARTSAATAPVTAPVVVAPVVTGATPTVSGTARSGQTLTANAGTWGPAGVSVGYQWLANGVAIAGATAPTFKLTNAQAGKKIAVTTTGSLAGAAPVSATSAATATVKGVLTPKKVSISGTAKVGKKLRAKTSSWGPSPVTSSYTWYRNGKKISGQKSSTYKLRKADAGKRITVRITQKKSNYVSVSKLSSKTKKVKK